MELHETLGTGDLLYWFGWSLALFVITFPSWIGNQLAPFGRQSFERLWGAALLLSYIFYTYLSVQRGEFSWGESLPIHLCGISRLLTITYLFTKKQWVGELVTFTGLAGGLQSLLTPEFTHGLQPFYIFDYYLNHASIMAIGIYIISVHKRPLQRGAWLRSFGRIQILALFALLVNLFVGGNYMYLMQAPIVDNPLVLRSESMPYLHVLGFEAIALANFGLIQWVLGRFRPRTVFA
jgi:hypothetical integral membrane protein (TIGR02206 family)